VLAIASANAAVRADRVPLTALLIDEEWQQRAWTRRSSGKGLRRASDGI
jgi:hypothetical protein